jgi:hypothetical protein
MKFSTTSATAASVLALSLIASPHAVAADGDWFVGAGGGFAWLEGGSDTTNGGAAFGGGGTVSNVDFDSATTYGALLGRRIGGGWALALSYDHVDADVSFIANFAAAPGFPSAFAGEVDSDIVMLGLIYAAPLSTTNPRWSYHVGAAAGVAFNTMAVTEDFFPFNGVADQTLAEGDNTSFAARGTVGLGYALDECWGLHASASVFTLGDFETGATRSPPVSAITPYEVDAWGYGLTLGVTARF